MVLLHKISKRVIMVRRRSSYNKAQSNNYKVYIQLLPESYKDLMDPKSQRPFRLRPGMSASADIKKTKTHDNRLAVPSNAVTTRDKNDTIPGKKKNLLIIEKKKATVGMGYKIMYHQY